MSANYQRITLENQIELLQIRIHELEDIIQELQEKDAMYDLKGSFPEGVARSEDQVMELNKAVNHWVRTEEHGAKLFRNIETAPIKVRDRLIMAWLFGTKCHPPSSPDGQQVDPRAMVAELMRQMFGKGGPK